VPLQVIGAGLGRTGTLSLKLALEQLGFGPCYHMVEVWADLERLGDWLAAVEGRPDWERIFAGYRATVDYPGCHFWRELSRAYPEAKVVLSVRDPGEWFESTQATIFAPQSLQLVAASPSLKNFMWKTVYDDFGSDIDDRDHMVAAFERHCDEVRRVIPASRLLVFEVSQGWKPLCEFLGVPVPHTAFPRRNSREEMAAMMAASRGVKTVDDIAHIAQDLVAELRRN
jgi:hypothetical protein